MHEVGVGKVVEKYLFYSDVNCDVRNYHSSCPQTSYVVVKSKFNILSVMSCWKWSPNCTSFLH
jgi:hypothetical protein